MSNLLTSLGSLITFTCIIYLFCSTVYSLYFHPLHTFPGPKLWIAFPILRHIAAIRGVIDRRTKSLHDEYGPVVRISSDELSFITAQAWLNIYGHGHTQYPKLTSLHSPELNIIGANDLNHTRFRKALSNGFTAKAFRDQEPLMKTYIDLLIAKLKYVTSSRLEADMVKWFNLTTFDMIGDLAFGASFNGLKNSDYHSWVSMIFSSVKIMPYFRMTSEYHVVMKGAMFLMPLMPKSLRKSAIKNIEYTTNTTNTTNTVMKRINDESMKGRGASSTGC